jgi:hypothetical protein
MNHETRRGIPAIMFPEFQVRAIDILAFQNTVLPPGGHQLSPLDQCMKGLLFFATADSSTVLRSRALSVASDLWFMFMPETTRPCTARHFLSFILQLRR